MTSPTANRSSSPRRTKPIAQSRLSRRQWALLLVVVSIAWSIALAVFPLGRSWDDSFVCTCGVAYVLGGTAFVTNSGSFPRRCAKAGLRSALVVAALGAIGCAIGCGMLWRPESRSLGRVIWQGGSDGFVVGAIVGTFAMAWSLRRSREPRDSTGDARDV